MTPRTVLVVGSLHHDIMVAASALPRRDETVVGTGWSPKFGGKGGNQAVAAARAGPARMLGAVGDDGFGAFLRKGLRAGGVDDRFVAHLPGRPSGMSVAINDPSGDYAAVIVSGANLWVDAGALGDPALWDDVAVLLLQNEVPEALNLAAARAARARGLPVILNAAPMRPWGALAGLIDVLVANAVEAAQLGADRVGSLARAEAAARRLGTLAPAVVVTAGAHGLAAVSAGDAFALPAEQVRVASTHGAGDAFCGTLAAGLAAGSSLRAACDAASLAAARHVSGA